MPIAPWLNVNPKDFVAAAQAGAELGQRIAQMRQQAAIEGAKIRSEEAMNAARVAASSAESGQRIAAAREEAAARIAQEQALREQNAREAQQRFALEQAGIDRQTAADMVRAQQGEARLGMDNARIQLEMENLNRQKDAASSLNDFRTQMIKLNQEREARLQQAQKAAEARATSGTLRIPIPSSEGDFSPPTITLPATDPRAQGYLNSRTNVPPALISPPSAGPSGATAPAATMRWNPETGDIEPIGGEGTAGALSIAPGLDTGWGDEEQ